MFAKFAPGARVDMVWLNGAPAARIDFHGEVSGAASLAVENGRITRIYAISNPHKLTGLDAKTELTRQETAEVSAA